MSVQPRGGNGLTKITLTEEDLHSNLQCPQSGAVCWYRSGGGGWGLSWWDLILLYVTPTWPEECRPKKAGFTLKEGMRITYMVEQAKWLYTPRAAVPDMAPMLALRSRGPNRIAWRPKSGKRRKAHGLTWEAWTDGQGRSVYWSTRARGLVERAYAGTPWTVTVRPVNGQDVILVRKFPSSLHYSAMGLILPDEPEIAAPQTPA